ncbi:hypothetical protein HH214_12455 [Mucilaginibacter robiniae]|uniref:CBM-cenC domain-containing protein n=1 Tax=Mucilaginibacter robiniae TaxID=2728022 RepID=A0A7L5E4J4_9SPHI|nr:hypothetical protein [Mucilaginibacter robiniae]QJD96634.1 hypothetical protein HH214_12455 [Mucilaginibacter robiniae]
MIVHKKSAANKHQTTRSQPIYYPTTCGQTTVVNKCAASVTLNAEAGQSNYLWSTGATTSSITVTTSALYWWETIDQATNKVVNGNFSAGNTGFTSDYTYKSPNSSTALYDEGAYTVTTNPHNVHPDFASFPDHTGDSGGQMMVVNGSVVAGVSIWKETINVQPNTDYIFSVWFTSVHPKNPGKLNFSINNTLLGAPIELTAGTPDWKNFTVRWSSGSSTSANIGIVNQNTAQAGNDFALDDLVFAPVCRNYFDVHLYTNPSKPSITSQ